MLPFHLVAMNIKDPDVERMAADLGHLLKTGKTGAVRAALTANLSQLQDAGADDRDRRYDAAMFTLSQEIWPHTQDIKPVTKAARMKILQHPAGKR